VESDKNQTIHQWLHWIITEVSADREYQYRAFVEHFSALMGQIYGGGSVSESGSYLIPGMKSDLEARIEWRLSSRVNYMGSNRLTLTCRLYDRRRGSAVESGETCFELATGRRIR